MFNLKKNLFNPKVSYVIGLLIYLNFSIFFGYNLVKSCINHEAISKILYLLVWVIAFMFEASLKWFDIIKPSPPKEIDKKPKNQIFSKQWYLENLGAIITMIMGISVGIILLIIVTINDGWTTSYTVSDPKFDIIIDLCYLLLGVCFLLNSLGKIPKLQEVPNFQKILDSKVLSLLQAVLAFSAFIMYMIYTSNLT